MWGESSDDEEKKRKEKKMRNEKKLAELQKEKQFDEQGNQITHTEDPHTGELIEAPDLRTPHVGPRDTNP